MGSFGRTGSLLGSMRFAVADLVFVVAGEGEVPVFHGGLGVSAALGFRSVTRVDLEGQDLGSRRSPCP